MCLHFLWVSKEICHKQTLPGFSESHILVRVAIATSSQTRSLFFRVRHCSEDFTYIISHSILSKPQWPGYYPYYINEEMVEGRSWRVNPRVPSFQRAYRELRTAVQLLQILSPMAWLTGGKEHHPLLRDYKASRIQHSSSLHFTLERESCEGKLSCLPCWKSLRKLSTHGCALDAGEGKTGRLSQKPPPHKVMMPGLEVVSLPADKSGFLWGKKKTG